jgi:hypothetical protein
MSRSPERTSGPLKALLVLGCNERIWLKETRLPFPPFPGLGIRIDVYDMLEVDSVVVGDIVGAVSYDVTCICTVEGGASYSDERLEEFGFEEGDYP